MVTNSILLCAFAVGTALSIGCARSGARHPPAGAAARAENTEHTRHGGGQGMMEMCPMKVPGTTATVADTADGVAISFTTSGDVAELRRRVHHMAEMRDRHHGMMGEGMMGDRKENVPPPGTSRPMEMMVPSIATVEDVERGARIVLVPKDPDRLSVLRQHARDHVGSMSRGECPMMAMKDHAQPGEE